MPGGTGTTATGTTSAPSSTATSNAGLSVVALAAGKKYFGSATDNPELIDTAYVAGLSNIKDFNQITPGNSMKWDATEPTRGTFTFSGGDAVVALAKKNGQLVRGHNCVWYNQLPIWVTSGGFNNTTLTSIVQNHCGTLVGHYKGQIYSWDVINEPFNDDGTWRSTVFYNTMGTSYVAVALQAARAADPAAKLYINDYNIEGTGAKSTAMVNLVKSLKATGVPIDGIGVQAHLIVGQVPSTLQANLAQFTALGVEVAITELDIRMTLPATAALLAQQKKDYQTVIAACKAVAGCIGVQSGTTLTSIPGFRAHSVVKVQHYLWTRTWKKPAYDGIVLGFTS